MSLQNERAQAREIERLKAELAAALADLKESSVGTCGLCKNQHNLDDCWESDCNGECKNWEWSGVQEVEG